VTNMRAPAVSYAGAGWPVFRVEVGGKAPQTTHGFKDATTDVDQVDQQWRRHPHANIGMPTGVRFDVLDLDVKPGGPNARTLVPQLVDERWTDGAVGLAETRNGGLHIFYPASGLPSGSIPRLGVDFKAKGGYILLPPSKVASAFPNGPGRYRWFRFPNSDGEPLNWPALRARLDPPTTFDKPQFTGEYDPSRRLDGLCRTVRESIEGSRNARLYWAACRLGDDGLLDQAACAALLDAALAAGLTDWEARRTIASAARRTGGAA